MDNQNQNTVNPVEENVVNSTEQETKDVVENATEVTKEAEVEASRKSYSEEILSVEHDEESEDETHESVEELTVHYSKMTRQELMEEIKTLANSENIQQMKLRSSLIRNSFKLLTAEAINLAKEKFLADGGVEEDFKFEDDVIGVEFNKYYSLYREKRQQYLEHTRIALLL